MPETEIFFRIKMLNAFALKVSIAYGETGNCKCHAFLIFRQEQFCALVLEKVDRLFLDKASHVR
jgi:hypothetical protein